MLGEFAAYVFSILTFSTNLFLLKILALMPLSFWACFEMVLGMRASLFRLLSSVDYSLSAWSGADPNRFFLSSM